MSENELKFEFYSLDSGQVKAVYDEIERRNKLKDEISDSPLLAKETAEERKQREADWFKSRSRILNEVMSRLGINLGSKFDPFDKILTEEELEQTDHTIFERDEVELEKMYSKDEHEDESQDSDTLSSLEVDLATKYTIRVREYMDLLFSFENEVFIALARDKMGDVVGMMNGFFKKDLTAEVIDLSVRDDLRRQKIGTRLHELVEGKLREKKVEEVHVIMSPDEDHRPALDFLKQCAIVKNPPGKIFGLR